MKNVSVLVAALCSVAMAACAIDGGEDDAPGELASSEAAQAVSTYNTLVNKAYDQCLDAPHGDLNVTLKLSICGGLYEKYWGSVPTGTPNVYFLVNKKSGLCMEVNNGTSTPGERVDEYYCNGSTAEQWYRSDIVIAGISYAQFTHYGTNQCLDTVSGPNSNVMQYTCDPIGSNAAQLWRVQ